jgi:hypothetical protein
MDLKIDFSELISKIKDLLKEEDGPLCEVETIMNDGSLRFSKFEVKSTMIPQIGDVFDAPPYDDWNDCRFTKVRVLHRELSYCRYDIGQAILTVEKV